MAWPRSPATGAGSCTCWSTTATWTTAKQALARAGIGVADAREVLVAELDARPGGLVDVMLALAEADVNVDLAYTVSRLQGRDRDRGHVRRARSAHVAAEMSDLAFAGLARQAELVRSGEVSARELVELSLSRIERFDPQLNAFGAVYAEQALEEAERPTPARCPASRSRSRTRWTSRARSRATGPRRSTSRARQDSEIVRRLRAAGAIVIGKTTMPELGLWPFTESITWGVTRNPWDTDRTPGGSSGGSAAAVAAGLVPAAVAADGAGSIRIPAACCGLFGLKPNTGRVPRTPHEDDGGRHWVCFGGLTRSVERREADARRDGAGDRPARAEAA